MKRLREQLPEHLAPFEHLHQWYCLLTQGEFGLAQDVAQPLVVHLFKRLLVGVLQDPGDGQRGLPLDPVQRRRQHHDLLGGLLVEQRRQSVADPVQFVSFDRAIQVQHLLAHAA